MCKSKNKTKSSLRLKSSTSSEKELHEKKFNWHGNNDNDDEPREQKKQFSFLLLKKRYSELIFHKWYNARGDIECGNDAYISTSSRCSRRRKKMTFFALFITSNDYLQGKFRVLSVGWIEFKRTLSNDSLDNRMRWMTADANCQNRSS